MNQMLPPRDPKFRKTIIMELDQVLISSSLRRPDHFTDLIVLNYKGKTHEVFVKVRKNLIKFLNSLSEKYELILYTAS